MWSIKFYNGVKHGVKTLSVIKGRCLWEGVFDNFESAH